MKILITTDVFPPNCGGSGWSTLSLARSLRDQGNDLFVITYEYEKKGVSREKYEGLDLVRIGKTRASDPVSRLLEKRKTGARFQAQIKKTIKNENIDIVHAAHMLSGMYTSAALKNESIPYVITIRDYWPVCLYSTMLAKDGPCDGCSSGRLKECFVQYNEKYKVVSPVIVNLLKREMEQRRRTLVNAAKVGFVSEYLRSKIIAEIPGINGAVIPNGLNIEYIRDVTLTKPKCQVKPDYILFAGKLEKYKGSDIIINLLKTRSFKTPLVVIGVGSEKESMIAAAAEFNKKAAFLGWLENEETLRLMKRAALIILPSIWGEPLSRVLLESAALGVPVVALDTGGTSEVIENGVNGILVSKHEKFPSAVMQLIKNVEKKKRIGKAVMKTAVKKFNQTVLTGKWISLYEEVINESKKTD